MRCLLSPQPSKENQLEEDVVDEGTMLDAIEQGLAPEAEETEGEAPAEEGKQEEPAEGAEQEAPSQDAGKPAEDDLTLPEGLSSKAQDRFRKLTGRLQETSTALKSAQDEVEQFREVVRSSMATPQEFSQAIAYMRMVKSGDLDGALRVLDEQRRQIALATGRSVPGTDPLADFPDLRARVDQYQMDEQAALEIARSRVMVQEIQRAQEQSQFSAQRQHAMQQERAQAVAAIDQLGAQWAKTDPDFQIKEDVILKRIPDIARNFPPSMWAPQVRMLYDALSAIPPPAPKKTAMPLRSSGKTGGAKQPDTMLEALTAGLNYDIE